MPGEALRQPLPMPKGRLSSTETRPRKPRYPIESVDNALRLLLAFQDRKEIGVTEASQLLGVAPSTAHRLLRMLQYRSLVEQDSARGTYLPGPALLEVGLAVVKGLDIRARARPALERIVSETEETAQLAFLQGCDILFLDCVESPKALRAGSRVGVTLPAECTAAGKAMLALLSREQLRSLYPNGRLRTLTEHSLRTLEQLERDLELTRRRGYAVNDVESEPGLRAVAVVLGGESPQRSAAITLAGPVERLPEERIPGLAKAILAAIASVPTASLA